jgi:hypothetical protein
MSDITTIVSDEALEQLQTLKNELRACIDGPLTKSQKINILQSAIESIKQSDSSGLLPLSYSQVKDRYCDLVRLIEE